MLKPSEITEGLIKADPEDAQLGFAKYLIVSFVTALVICILVITVNVIVDPLWLFGHSSPLNVGQDGFDERQLKTNHLHFFGLDADTLLLGSSRMTIVDSQMMKGRSFNYSVSNMLPHEYDAYTSFARSRQRKDFQVIMIGLDFFGSSQERVDALRLEAPEAYINRSQEWNYRYRSLLSLDTLDYSIRNMKLSAQLALGGKPTRDYYLRNGRKVQRDPEKERVNANIRKDLQVFDKMYGSDYRYNSRFREVLSVLRKNHPNTKFLVFTTPEYRPLFDLAMKNGRSADYSRWLTEIVEVFGGFYDFSGVNSVTSNSDNYVDAHHFRPHVARWIIDTISGEVNPEKPKDFGAYVTPETLSEHLAPLKVQTRQLLGQ
jgi:hypothetical protein